MAGHRREVLDRVRRLDDFADVEVAARIRPDAVQHDKVTGQDRIGAAHACLNVTIEVTDRNSRDRLVTDRGVLHQLEMRSVRYRHRPAQLGDIEVRLLVDEKVAGPIDPGPDIDQLAGVGEDLDARVLPIGDEDAAVGIDGDRVRQVELARPGSPHEALSSPSSE